MRHFLRAALFALAAIPATAQHAAIPVPPTVTLDGVPPIPAAIADRFAPYGEFRFAEFLGWHPVRREMLIATSFGPRRHIHLVDGPGRARTQLTFGPPITGEASFEPARGEYFIFVRDASGGSERPQIYRFDVATRAITLVTDGASRNGGNAVVWSNTSGLIAFDSNRRTNKDRDIWVVDPADPASARLVLEAAGNWIAQDWSPDDRELLVEERVSTDVRNLWRVDVKTGARTALTPNEKGTAAWIAPRFSRDGTRVYAMSNRGGEFMRLWRMDVASLDWTPVTPDGTAVEGYSVAPDGRTIAVVFDRDAESVLELIDPSTGRTRSRPKLRGGTIRSMQWHPKLAELAVTLGSIDSPMDVYSVAADTGRVERWTTSEVGGYPSDLPSPEIVRWKSFDGLTITGVLYRPPSRFKGPRPVIINIHGGPDARERPRFLGRSGSFLDEFGIALIYPNVRGSIGFGKAFQAADNGKQREDSVKDVGALLDWIGQQPYLDKNRVMVTGASYGGYMTYAVAATYSDRIRCAHPALGISNFVTYMETTEPVRLTDRRSEYGDERDPETREFFTQISPITHASKIRVPLFIAHGAKDTRVPIAQAVEMAKAVRANEVPVWLAIYGDEGHNPFNNTNNDLNLFIWAKFVEEYLLR
jgi:dipeptidyl aminopeptidase/acylaminoacyl peptidase